MSMLSRVARTCVLWATLSITMPASGQTIIYVDDDSAPGGDGTSWLMAFGFLQDALAAAAVIPEPRDVQIWVAQGIYKPDEDELNPPGTGDRLATFGRTMNQ